MEIGSAISTSSLGFNFIGMPIGSGISTSPRLFTGGSGVFGACVFAHCPLLEGLVLLTVLDFQLLQAVLDFQLLQPPLAGQQAPLALLGLVGLELLAAGLPPGWV